MNVQGPYNPLDRTHLGESIAQALLDRPVEPLPPSIQIRGAGIYAIYYSGPYPAYAPLADRNRDGKFETPIYVGKAEPPGSDTGAMVSGAYKGNSLQKRLTEHSQSVGAALNLELADFQCRYLVLDDIWIPLGESLLITRFRPVWNGVVKGFGIHAPGGGRSAQQTSLWDTLHPGRSMAEGRSPNKRSATELHAIIQAHFAKYL
jgi:hypothetical protein